MISRSQANGCAAPIHPASDNNSIHYSLINTVDLYEFVKFVINVAADRKGRMR